MAGDGFFFTEVLHHTNKEWVSSMFVPVAVFFALACLVTSISLAVKIHLIAKKLMGRNLFRRGLVRATSLGAIRISKNLSEHKSVAELKEKFDLVRMEARRNYCYILIALLQDIPMGARRIAAAAFGGVCACTCVGASDSCLCMRAAGMAAMHVYGCRRLCSCVAVRACVWLCACARGCAGLPAMWRAPAQVRWTRCTSCVRSTSASTPSPSRTSATCSRRKSSSSC
jgi:hypothetical protein